MRWIVLTLALVMVLPGMAHAQEAPPPDLYSEGGDVLYRDQIMPTGEYCTSKRRWHKVYYAPASPWLIELNQVIGWCRDGGRVQRLTQFNLYGVVSSTGKAFGWNWDSGVEATLNVNCTGSIGSQCCPEAGGCLYVRRYRQKRAESCFFGVCEEAHVWINQYVRGVSPVYSPSSGLGSGL